MTSPQGKRSLQLAVASTLVVATMCFSAESRAEEHERREPLLGLYLQPLLSVTLPGGSAGPVTDVYGTVQPTGAVGVSIHPVRRFSLAVDLEFHGWSGQMPAAAPAGADSPEAGAFSLQFLNYYVHFRGRVMLVRRGRVQLDADIAVGIAIGREDGDRFRAEGVGPTVGLGPLLSISLGNYVALSFNISFESAWITYDLESPQSRSPEGEDSYTLVWPRFLVGMGLSGYLAHRRPRSARSEEPAAEEAVEPAEEPAAGVTPAPAEPTTEMPA